VKIVGIIPARYASTRFPGKPLIDIAGKSMIQRVFEQAKKSTSLSEVIVATDDARIEQHVKAFGGNVIMTADSHQSGTDRCFEAIQKYNGNADVVINIQGDEPFIQPQQIDLLAACFNSNDVQLATLIKKISNNEELFNVNTPKVIIDENDGNAIYFSRQTIPYIREKQTNDWLANHTFYKHIGIYGYTIKALSEITVLQPSLLERAEGLEQLRWIENGYKIKVNLTDFESVAIDVPDDLKKLTKFL
jgi:3-deoxy-manno-octulosonate cytidylyltransferase (CMP-KDO synthetase)